MQQRDWLHVNDHADGVGHVLDHGASGEAYNIRGMGNRHNRDVTQMILELLDKPWSLVRSVPDRPGHDRRYSMDGSKLRALGWKPTRGVRESVESYRGWLSGAENVGAILEYADKQMAALGVVRDVVRSDA